MKRSLNNKSTCHFRILLALAATSLSWQVHGKAEINRVIKPGDGGRATNATIDSPTRITVDSAGNLYIYERHDERGRDVIRRVDAKTHIITTLPVQGCNVPNRSGRTPLPEDCFGRLAQIRSTPSGDLLLLERGWNRNRLRRLDLRSFTLTTVKDNSSSSFDHVAPFPHPGCLTVDNSGNIFVCDGAFRIPRIDGQTGKIISVAGIGTHGRVGLDLAGATQTEPLGLAVAPSGDLYIATEIARGTDTFAPTSYRIRRVDASTGRIETIAGAGAEVIDDSGFQANGQDAREAELCNPSSLVLDRAGNLFFVNGETRVVRIDLASGRIFALAGSDRRGTSGDGGLAIRSRLSASDLAIDPEGNLFVADWRHNRIRRIDAKTKLITTFAGNGRPRRKPLAYQ